jgi:transposase-like protein
MVSSNGHHRSTEVQPRTSRRRFTAEYKRRIVEEAAGCQYGEVGALLRREGLYHSNLRKWRAEYEAGTLSEKPRGPRANPGAAEMKRLAQENAQLKRQLVRAEAIIEAQKKLARLLESNSEEKQP